MQLHEMEHGRAAVENDGLVFLPVEVDDLFFLGDGGERLRGEAERFKCCGGGVQLAKAAVDEDERGHGLAVFLQSLVAAGYDLAHGGEVIDSDDGLDFEFAVGGFVHLAVFPHDHGGDGFCALDVRDVEALDAPGQFGKHEESGSDSWIICWRAPGRGIAGCNDCLAFCPARSTSERFSPRWGTLNSTLWPMRSLSRFGERFAVGEICGDKNGARDVVLIDVELLEQGGEEGSRVELGSRGSEPRSMSATSSEALSGSIAPAGLPRRIRGGRRFCRRGRGRD